MADPYRSIFRSNLFDGQVALVTGGGSGIGRCAAHELASLGARIALVGRSQDKLEKVKAEIGESGGEAEYFIADIRDEPLVKQTIGSVLARYGRIDHLVNNAGGQFGAPLEAISLKGWDAVVRSNLHGGFLVARECFTQWMKTNGGAIVCMLMDMWSGVPNMGHSGAARAGMANFIQTAASEWGPFNVRVNGVAPGGIASSGYDTYPPHMTEYLRTYKNYVPLGRDGTEAETSSAIVYLLSEGARYITGATIRIDGGISCNRPWYKLPERQADSPVYDGFPLSRAPDVLTK